MPLKAVLAPDLAVPTAAVMRFAVIHDLSYPDLIAFVRLHARLPRDLVEFQATAWRAVLWPNRARISA